MPTYDARVAASINDAREHPTNAWSHTLSNLFLDEAGQRRSYTQWRPGIVSGSTVSAASLFLTSSMQMNIGVPVAYIQADRIENVVNTLDTDLSGTGFAGTGIQVNLSEWELDTEYEFDITAMVQAWIARGAYSSLDWFTVYITCVNGDARAYAWDGDPDKAARLSITYDLPADLTPDPFTRVYEAIWTMLEASPSFTALVKAGNRIKLSGANKAHKAEKETLNTADVPEVQVRMIGGQGNLTHSSSTTTMSTRVEIQIRTGSWLYDFGKFNEVRFAILRAMADWRDVLSILTWKNNTFVLDFNAPTIADGITQTDQDNDRGLKGWATVWTAEVRMQFATADLKE